MITITHSDLVRVTTLILSHMYTGAPLSTHKDEFGYGIDGAELMRI